MTDKVLRVLAEICVYRHHIQSLRKLILECEDEIADVQDMMPVCSARKRRERSSECKEIQTFIASCRGRVGRYERWMKRLRREM
jgi:hypothetical protein